MEFLMNSPPYFQVTLAAVLGVGALTIILSLVVYKFFLPRLGRALLSPVAPEQEQEGQTQPRSHWLINPEYCTACQAEHERSIRNESNIAALDKKVDFLKDGFLSGFQGISKEIGDMKTEIISALAVHQKGGAS
jgi:hypothetical protein